MANTIRIYKTTNAELIDAQFSGDGERLRALYTAALQQYEQFASEPLSTMVTDLASLEVPWDAATAEFFANQWHDEPGRADADPILRHGFQEAVQVALGHEPPVPLATFWVTGAGDEFEVLISDGDDRVTVFVVVPGTPGENDFHAGSMRARNKSWVVTAGGRTNDEGRGQPQPLADSNVVKIEVSGRADS